MSSSSDAEEDSALRLHIWQLNGQTLDVSVPSASISVEHLKQILSERTGVPLPNIRLVYNQRCTLKDHNSLESYNITSDCTIKMYRIFDNGRARDSSSSNNNSSSSGAKGNGDHSLRNSLTSTQPLNFPASNHFKDMLLNEKLIEAMFSNPDFIERILRANPKMREAMDKNPMLASMLKNPKMVSESIQLARNPEMAKELHRNYDRALMNLDATPGGFRQIKQMYNEFLEPLESLNSEGPFPTVRRENPAVSSPTSSEPEPPKKKINTKPLPNPWRQDETKPSFGGGADPFGHILQPGMTFPAMSLGQGSPAGNGKGRASNGGLPNPFLTLPRRPRPADTALAQATEDFSRLRISRSSPYVRPVGPIASQQQQQQQQQQHRQQGSQSRRSPGSGIPVTDRPSNIQHLDTSSRNQPKPSPADDDDREQQQQATDGARHSVPESNDTVSDTNSEAYEREGKTGKGGDRETQRQMMSKFEEELSVLESMGFTDRIKNLRILTTTNGDLAEAVDLLDEESESTSYPNMNHGRDI